jgi:hypothetical protein
MKTGSLRLAGIALAIGITLTGCQGSVRPSPTPPGPTESVACEGDVTTALQTAVNAGADPTVSISPGTCELSGTIDITKPATIDGAGSNQTFLVQTVRKVMLRVTASHVTVEDINLDSRTHNLTLPPMDSETNPDPNIMGMNGSDETLRDVTASGGNGFGIRFVAPSGAVCRDRPNSGIVVQNVSITTTGLGGYGALGLDCLNSATLTNITISGGIVALYLDNNVTINGLSFTSVYEQSGGKYGIPCQNAVEITTGNNFTLRDVNGGPVANRYGATSVSIANDQVRAGCPS